MRAKYTPRTKLRFVQGVFRSCGGPCVSVLVLTDRGAAGNSPALSGIVPPLRRRDNIRGTKDERTEVNDGTAQLYSDVEAV